MTRHSSGSYYYYYYTNNTYSAPPSLLQRQAVRQTISAHTTAMNCPCTRGEVHTHCVHELYNSVRAKLLLLEKVPNPCAVNIITYPLHLNLHLHLTHAVNIITYPLHSLLGYYLPSTTTRLPHLNNALRMVILLRAVDTFCLYSSNRVESRH